MDAFQVYLPSNDCPVLFPDNTATDIHTRFDKPINLHGAWEVGVGSIAYSSHINDEKEHAQLHLRATALQGVQSTVFIPTTITRQRKDCVKASA